MATITGNRCEHATLSTTTVDTVTLNGPISRVTVINRAAAGGTDLAVTISTNGTAPATPTQQGDDTYWIPAGGGFKTFAAGSGVIVKVLGNGNAYSVEGEQVGAP